MSLPCPITTIHCGFSGSSVLPFRPREQKAAEFLYSQIPNSAVTRMHMCTHSHVHTCTHTLSAEGATEKPPWEEQSLTSNCFGILFNSSFFSSHGSGNLSFGDMGLVAGAASPKPCILPNISCPYPDLGLNLCG